jgi:hypothetical protein
MQQFRKYNHMDFYEYLVEKFGYNEPIFLNEIKFKNYSQPWINKALADMCASGKIIRFDKGIYYIPKITFLGVSKLNVWKVIEKKYISNGNNCFGYYSGNTFLNQTGFSSQVPNIVEIYTNDENSKVREVMVGSMRVMLRKSRTLIDKNNVAVLSFLEMMNFVSPSFFDDERKKIATDYIINNGITRGDITKYAPVFPDKAMRTLIESEVIYNVAQ